VLNADLGPAIRNGQPGFFISEFLKRAFTKRELINTRTHKHPAVADVRDGSNSDFGARNREVRCTPVNGHAATTAACPKRAKRRRSPAVGMFHRRLSQTD